MQFSIRPVIIAVISSLILFGCGQPTEVKIGEQIWTTQNLDVDTFRNGSRIPHASTKAQWERAEENEEPAWCYYNNDTVYGKKHGRLYNWYAVTDSRGLAPKGWHIPTKKEWDELEDFLEEAEGKYNSATGNKLKKKDGWGQENEGDNWSGFSAIPCGYRAYFGEFQDTINEIMSFQYAKWWSSTEDMEAWSATKEHTNFAFCATVFSHAGHTNIGSDNKGDGLSIRCIKDKEEK
jgi:uncharacterized protein (TIGR02145 family)